MTTIKPGTRCENWYRNPVNGAPRCLHWAERMAMVPYTKQGVGYIETPMCEPCATYHEDAENARMTGQFDAPEEGAR